MVIHIQESTRLANFAPAVRPARRLSLLSRPHQSANCLHIGLLNNMAGAAFKTTERQFLSLLDAASGDIPIKVSFYMLPGLSRTESGGSRFANHYAGIEALFDAQLDGLIVTGREPRMSDLRAEPYWNHFTQVVEWARKNTLSTIWSCLAAHAAILHLDGIGRLRSTEKTFGLFNCINAAEHPLTHGLPPTFLVPHSRWNGLPEAELKSHGYNILSRMEGREADSFVKHEDSLFVFFQGHLEYDIDTLMREYRRDTSMFLRGESDVYPGLPKGYLDSATASALTSLREQALRSRTLDLIAHIGAATQAAALQHAWRSSASHLYKNWLQWISQARRGANGESLVHPRLSLAR